MNNAFLFCMYPKSDNTQLQKKKYSTKTTTCCTTTNSSSSVGHNVSRRNFCFSTLPLSLTSFLLLTPKLINAQESGQLPDGAKQFSQIISAQKQWNTLPNAFNDGRIPDEKEWENLRTYLRAVYAVSGDMDFLARKWKEKSRREIGLKTISKFRKAIMDMDKPAIKKDIDAFLTCQNQVAGLFDEFFVILKEDTVGDMPAEL